MNKGTKTAKTQVVELPPAEPTSDACFTYRKFREYTIDGTEIARRIEKALASKATSPEVAREIKDGVTLMMLAAGIQLTERVPLNVRFLAAHQHVQNFYGGLLLSTSGEVDRQLAVTRAACIVTDALGQLKRPEVLTAERLAVLIDAPETPPVVRDLLRYICVTVDCFAAEQLGPEDFDFQMPGPGGDKITPALVRRKLPAMLRRVSNWQLADWQPHELRAPDEEGGSQ